MKRFTILAVLLVLAGCGYAGAPVPVSADPVAQGHAFWCGQVPPSPYCTISEPDR
jgi:hypothetical protein